MNPPNVCVCLRGVWVFGTPAPIYGRTRNNPLPPLLPPPPARSSPRARPAGGQGQLSPGSVGSDSPGISHQCPMYGSMFGNVQPNFVPGKPPTALGSVTTNLIDALDPA